MTSNMFMWKTPNRTLITIAVTAFSSGIQASNLNIDKQNERNDLMKKNVLLIAVDDLKPLLNCYGDNIAQTPNLDRLASKGTLFTAAYCQQAVSAASRSSLLTGWYPDRTRVWDLKTLIRDENPEVVTLPQYFKENGYTTVGIGKIYDPRSVDKKNDVLSWTLPYLDHFSFLNPDFQKPIMSQYQDPSTHEAYDIYYNQAKENGLTDKNEIDDYIQSKIKPSNECIVLPDDAYADGATANGAIEFLSTYKSPNPFFFAVGFKKPHLPFCAPKQYWDLYKRDEIPLAMNRKKAINSPNLAYHNSGEIQSYTDIPPLISFTDIDNAILPDDKARELIHGYYASISYIDAQLGKVLDALEKNGYAYNTIIVLWGDHGWHLGDHGMWSKHTNFEHATRVPLLIIDPSIQGNNKVENPIEFLSIYPTLCDLAGLDVPKNLDGDNLSAIIKKEENIQAIKPYAVSQYPRSGKMGYSIRDSRYRYTIWVGWENRHLNVDAIAAEELYDYDKDPNETINVVSNIEYSNVLKIMRTYWEDYKANVINDIISPSQPGIEIINETFNDLPWENTKASIIPIQFNTINGIWTIFNTEINIDQTGVNDATIGALIFPKNAVNANLETCPFVEIPIVNNGGVKLVEIMARYGSKANVYSQLELQKLIGEDWVKVGETSIDATNSGKPTRYTIAVNDNSDNIQLRLYYNGDNSSSAIRVHDIIAYGSKLNSVANLLAHNITQNSFEIQWDKVTSADNYEIIVSSKNVIEYAELVKNGDAELVDASWVFANAEISSEQVFDGDMAFRLTSTDSNASIIQKIPIDSDTNITITAKAFIKENATGAGVPITYKSELRLWGQFLNDRLENVGNVRIAGLKELKEPSNAWFDISLENIPVPNDAITLDLDFRAQVGVKAFLDNISVEGIKTEYIAIPETPIITNLNRYKVSGLIPDQEYSVYVYAVKGDHKSVAKELIVKTNNTTGNRELTSDRLNLYLENNILYLTNLAVEDVIYIVNSSGQVIYHSRVNDISFEKELSKGFYLVRVGNITYKVNNN